MSDVPNQGQVPSGPPQPQDVVPPTAPPPAQTQAAPPRQASQQTVVGPDSGYDPVDEYPERPYEEARLREDGSVVPNINPGDPEHQETRLQESTDYVVGDLRELGYEAPEYGGD